MTLKCMDFSHSILPVYRFYIRFEENTFINRIWSSAKLEVLSQMAVDDTEASVEKSQTNVATVDLSMILVRSIMLHL